MGVPRQPVGLRVMCGLWSATARTLARTGPRTAASSKPSATLSPS